MSRKDNWRALFGVLHLTRDMPIKEIHKKVLKSGERISYSTIRNWKTGRVNYPRHETMLVVLKSLGYKFVIAPKNADNIVEDRRGK